MPKVGSVNCELIVGVEFGLHCIVAGPRISGAAFENEHSVVDGWAVEGTKGVDFRRWGVLSSC